MSDHASVEAASLADALEALVDLLAQKGLISDAEARSVIEGEPGSDADDEEDLSQPESKRSSTIS